MAGEPIEGPKAGWSPGRVDLLRLHFNLGLSAKLSAELIGGGITRNAVISKRRRLGLMGVNPFQATMRLARRARMAPAPLCRLWIVPPAQPPAESVCPLPFMDWLAPAGATPKTLAQRKPGECAWPLGPVEAPGDYRTLFCCAQVEPGRSYCTAHYARTLGSRRNRHGEGVR